MKIARVAVEVRMMFCGKRGLDTYQKYKLKKRCIYRYIKT